MSIPAATTTACSLCASRWRHSVRGTGGSPLNICQWSFKIPQWWSSKIPHPWLNPIDETTAGGRCGLSKSRWAAFNVR